MLDLFRYFILLLILSFISCVVDINIFSINTATINNITTYSQLYTFSRELLKSEEDNFLRCIKKNSYSKCLNKNPDYYSDLYTRSYCLKYDCDKSFFDNFHLNFSIIIQPYIKIQPKLMILIPIAPSELISRILIRNTIRKYKIIQNYTISYVFVMGKPIVDYNSYPLQYIYEEHKEYNDILLFNYTNSYYLITLQVLLGYKYILSNYQYVKFIIRLNTDVFIIPENIPSILSNSYDIYGLTVNKWLDRGFPIYPQGSFCIFSTKMLRVIMKNLYITQPEYVEDRYIGQIISILNKTNEIKIMWFNESRMNLLMDYNNYQDVNVYPETLALHPLNAGAISTFWLLYNRTL